jgi:glutathione S-transferase
MIRLHGPLLSRDVYRVRLLLGLQSRPHELIGAPTPRLEDDGAVIDDPWAMLTHLAGSGDWSAGPHWLGASRDLAADRGSRRLFRQLDEHLWFAEREGAGWLEGRRPTIADIACFPEVMMSEEDGLSRLPYPALRRWSDRVRRLPGFTVTPGIFSLP